MDFKFSNYVCCRCFRRLEDCTCISAPEKLIGIDPGIQEPIRILNEKGWKTAYCCESHFHPENKKGEMYISFARNMRDFPFFPEGWKVSKTRDGVAIYGEIKCSSKIPEKKVVQYKENKAQRMTELLLWVESLPVNKVD